MAVYWVENMRSYGFRGLRYACYFLLGCVLLFSAGSIAATTAYKIITEIDLYNNFSVYDQRLQCEYYKHQATTFCKSNYSDYDERIHCAVINKERWCNCMGQQKDCYKQQPFYW